MIIQTNRDHIIIWANQTALDMKPDAVGKRCYEAFLNSDVVCTNCPCEKAIASGGVERSLVHHQTVNGIEGESYWSNVCIPVKDENGRLKSFLEIARNMTREYQLSRQIKREKSRFEKIFNTTAAGMRLINKDYTVVDINDTLLNMMKKEKAEIIGHKCYDTFFSELCGTEKCPMKVLEHSNQKMSYEVKKQTDTGGFVYVQQMTTRFEEEDGSFFGIVESFIDIGEKKKTENDLKKASHEALIANQVKAEFINNMSHELRTPLNGIIGFSQMLGGTHLQTNQAEYLNYIQQSSENLLQIVDDILDFSKIHKGIMHLEREPVNLHELLREEILSIDQEAIKKNLKTGLLIGPGVPRKVQADGHKLKQIIRHLLENAVKFTESGSVKLKAEKVDHSSNTGVKFIVEDTGIGIAQKDQNRIMNSFTQVDSSLTRQYNGTGIGLAIVSKILKLKGSELHLESAEGEGCTFSFILNLEVLDESVEEDSSKLREREIQERGKQFAKKIMVAEDNPINLKLIKIIATDNFPDFDIIEAIDGVEAIEKFKTLLPDMIFMDIRMPKLDGFEATKMIRAQEKDFGRRTPIVGLSAEAREEKIREGLSIGLDDYLTKPLDSGELVKTIRHYLLKN